MKIPKYLKVLRNTLIGTVLSMNDKSTRKNKMKGTLAPFWEFVFCRNVVSLCLYHPRLEFYPIPII